jgi:hypothetical protein
VVDLVVSIYPLPLANSLLHTHSLPTLSQHLYSALAVGMTTLAFQKDTASEDIKVANHMLIVEHSLTPNHPEGDIAGEFFRHRRCGGIMLLHVAQVAPNIVAATAFTASPAWVASTSAFDTVEVFEGILLQLSFADLLRVQRVSSYWKAVIDRSPKIQTALFFKPEIDTARKTRRFRDHAYTYVVQDKKPYIPRAPGAPEPTADQYIALCAESRSYAVNPLFFTRIIYPTLDQLWFESQLPEARCRPGKAMIGHKMCQDVTSLLGNGSWRKMLLTQPPNPDLGISELGTRNSSWGTIAKHCLSGPTKDVTLGPIVDNVFEAASLGTGGPHVHWTVLISAVKW